MTFGPIPAHDYPAIARAVAAERRSKPLPDLRGLSAEAKRETEIALREDPHIWAAIVEWADHLAAIPRPAGFPGEGIEEAEYLAAVTLRTATAALRKWIADGQPGGEPEARAFKMLNLAERFARLVRNPRPTIDWRTGAVLTLVSPAERKAA